MRRCLAMREPTERKFRHRHRSDTSGQLPTKKRPSLTSNHESNPKNAVLPLRRNNTGSSSRDEEMVAKKNSDQHANAAFLNDENHLALSHSYDSIDVSRPRTRRGLGENPDGSTEATQSLAKPKEKDVWTPQGPMDQDRPRERSINATADRILVPSTTIDNSTNQFQDMYANIRTDQDD